MSQLLGPNGQPVKETKVRSPEEQILGMLQALEGSRRISDDHLKAVIIGVVEGGWQIGHDKNLPPSKAMVRNVSTFMRDAMGNLQMLQQGIVALGDDFLPILNAMAPAQEEETEKPSPDHPPHHC